MGFLHFFLGIEACYIGHDVCFNQRKYTGELISEFGLSACKPVLVPMDQGLKLNDVATNSDPCLPNSSVYQRLIGKLIYLTITRPDISFVVHVLSQFMYAPKQSHFSAALKVLKYLKEILFVVLCFIRTISFVCVLFVTQIGLLAQCLENLLLAIASSLVPA